uniref:Uncharacterized protein n=1 Tax=Chromera velia CCMP2878 TaxID=1169474 RepID=A0A0G4IBI1_9ALVE|eukprot:Cvel_2196.t1-p1 / transcript=Cvel_2196.t1 / gene=Cvel_2196 / organism=Chromera_velia_CCMP2878 / gene_product=hypothetical protein / transcript_product=hypothetical protein / location=Cvel_scaffold85:11711-13111(+) / protein_length=467 / sequence_SO=supercontig / SO=protein_coding / is_pseudo=false
MSQRQFSYPGISSTPVDMYGRPVGLPHQPEAFDQYYGRPLQSPFPQAHPSMKVSRADSLGGSQGPHLGAPVQKERRGGANLGEEAFVNDRRRAASRMQACGMVDTGSLPPHKWGHRPDLAPLSASAVPPSTVAARYPHSAFDVIVSPPKARGPVPSDALPPSQYHFPSDPHEEAPPHHELPSGPHEQAPPQHQLPSGLHKEPRPQHQSPSGLHEEPPPQHDSAKQQQQAIPGSPIDGLSQQVRKSLDLEGGDDREEKEDEQKREPPEPCRLRHRQNTEGWDRDEEKYAAGLVAAAERDKEEATLSVKDRSSDVNHGLLSQEDTDRDPDFWQTLSQRQLLDKQPSLKSWPLSFLLGGNPKTVVLNAKVSPAIEGQAQIKHNKTIGGVSYRWIKWRGPADAGPQYQYTDSQGGTHTAHLPNFYLLLHLLRVRVEDEEAPASCTRRSRRGGSVSAASEGGRAGGMPPGGA